MGAFCCLFLVLLLLFLESMKKPRQLRSHGQAIVEYLIVFSFMAIIAIKMATGLQGFVKTTMGGLSKALTWQLSSGVCPRNCFYKSFSNGI